MVREARGVARRARDAAATATYRAGAYRAGKCGREVSGAGLGSARPVPAAQRDAGAAGARAGLPRRGAPARPGGGGPASLRSGVELVFATFLALLSLFPPSLPEELGCLPRLFSSFKRHQAKALRACLPFFRTAKRARRRSGKTGIG